jgi:TRAP-type C4-dicarboxylate transport system permease small subunit
VSARAGTDGTQVRPRRRARVTVRLRLPVVIFGKLIVIGFIALVGWIGYSVLEVLATDYLISLPKVSVAWTQSVIPVSCALFILAELLNLPATLRAARGLESVAASDLAERLH